MILYHQAVLIWQSLTPCRRYQVTIADIYGLGMFISAIVHGIIGMIMIQQRARDPMGVGLTWVLCILLWPLAIVFLADAVYQGATRGTKIHPEGNGHDSKRSDDADPH